MCGRYVFTTSHSRSLLGVLLWGLLANPQEPPGLSSEQLVRLGTLGPGVLFGFRRCPGGGEVEFGGLAFSMISCGSSGRLFGWTLP